MRKRINYKLINTHNSECTERVEIRYPLSSFSLTNSKEKGELSLVANLNSEQATTAIAAKIVYC